MRRLTLLAATIAAGAALVPPAGAAAAPAIVHSWRVNLDADPHMEHVQLVVSATAGRGGRPGHWLRIVDRVDGRTTTVRISPVLDHLRARWVTFGDFDVRGRVQIFYHGYDGGSGAMPVSAGIRGWTGKAKRLFWSYAPPHPSLLHDGRRYRYAGAAVALENLVPAGTPGLEVHLVQREARAADPGCCPSRLLVRDYRFSPSAAAWRLFRTVWKPS